MTDIELEKHFKQLTADVKSKHLAAMIIVIEAAKKFQGDQIPLHRMWCSFTQSVYNQCECGAFEFDDAVELLIQVEAGKR